MSTLNVSNITDGTTTVGTSYVVNGSAKAWCNFQADGPSVRDSFNTASVTDNGNCNYTFNFSSNMANGNYSASGYVKDGAAQNAARTASSIDGDTYSASSLQVRPSATSDVIFTVAFDPNYVCFTTFGDLA
jgi:hypothetical protein